MNAPAVLEMAISLRNRGARCHLTTRAAFGL
jgi:hypothetical protein